MVSVTISCGKNGVLKKCEADGHAGFSRKGSDVVCSAITILLKTAMELLSRTENVVFEADSAARGNLFFSVEAEKDDPQTESMLKCTAEFLKVGIGLIQKEYPGNVRLKEKKLAEA